MQQQCPKCKGKESMCDTCGGRGYVNGGTGGEALRFVDKRELFRRVKKARRMPPDEIDKKIKNLRKEREKIADEMKRAEGLKKSEEQEAIWKKKLEEISKKVEELKKMKKDKVVLSKQVKLDDVEIDEL